MTPEQQREVWEMLDKGHLAEVVRKGPEPIFATISGAHLYGFASPFSHIRRVFAPHSPTFTNPFAREQSPPQPFATKNGIIVDGYILHSE